jgi:hypothetical protein
MEQQEYEAMRRFLEGIAARQVEQAADVHRLIEHMDARLLVAENTLSDVRLTLTGIGSLAKSLAERQEQLAARQQVHEDIMKSLAAILVKQDTINDRLTTSMERLDRTSERLSTSIERLEGILVGIRDLLRRGNGRTEG